MTTQPLFIQPNTTPTPQPPDPVYQPVIPEEGRLPLFDDTGPDLGLPRQQHGLAHATDTATWIARQPSNHAGFGTPAGITRTCYCGYHTRSGKQFAQHLYEETIMNNPLAFLDDPHPQLKHRLTDTAEHGRVLICSCGRTMRGLTRMQEHIRAMQETHHDHA